MKQGIKRTLFAISGTLVAINVIAQWTPIHVPTNNNLNSISLLEENYGWIVGDKGTMLYLDKDSWVSYPAVTDQNLYSVFLLNESDGWAVGSRGTILQLKDKSWTKASSPTRQDLYSVTFSAAGIGYAAGNNGTFLCYRNGIWEMAEPFMPGHLYTVVINNNDQPYLAGGRENITVPIMKADYSDTYRFTKIHDPGYYEITGLAIPDTYQVWAVGKPGTILHFNGLGWEKINTVDKLPSLTGIYFRTKDNGIIVGYGGTILTYNSDGWQKEDSNVSVKLNGTVISGNTYYAVGNSGTVLRLRRSLPVPEETKNSYPLALASYPNPSSGLVNITIPDKAIANSFITVLNSRGQAVIIKELDSGRQGETDQINTAGLSNGIYIVNIVSGGQIVASGKFIVKN